MLLNNMWKLMAAPATLLLSMTAATAAFADDTELYSATYTAGTTGKPKVLIMFDDSGSMSTIIPGSKPVYNPNSSYVTKVPANRIYWSTTSSVPDVNGTQANQWFPASANSCGQSYTPLGTTGRFGATAAQRWVTAAGNWVTTQRCTGIVFAGNCYFGSWVTDTTWQGTAAAWTTLSGNANNPYSVDCKDDVDSTNNTNASGIAAGYPLAPAASAPNTADTNAYSSSKTPGITWSGGATTFFTSNYVNWTYDTTIVTQDKTFIRTAQEVIEHLISSNPSIDFGLEVFNDNSNSNANPPTSTGDNGGRIVKRIVKDMTDTDRTNLINTVWALTAGGNTPLCETAWEAYLYLTGGTPKYARSGDSSDVPLRDTAAESGGKYISPLEKCTNTYMVYMTDGEPTSDSNADSLVKALSPKPPGLTSSGACPTYGSGSTSFTSCLAPLAKYMGKDSTDLDGDSANGIQNAKMATIGFNVGPEATALLTDAATLLKPNGDVAYYPASGAADLTASFNEIILGILTSETTFTSPAVAVDSFSRTESRDDVFFAMFEPGSTADWWGNLKKLKIKKVSGSLAYVDATDTPAVGANGAILDSARTYWSTAADGGKINAGGAGGLLKSRALTLRSIKTNTGTNGALQALNSTNVTAAAYGLPNNTALLAFWQATDATDLANTINWGWGYDVDDVDHDTVKTDTRPWIMADILHSMPLTVNYGARGSYTKTNPDLRVMVGTNDGLLHMFKNDDGTEVWAFFPKELGPVLTKRRKNIRATGKTNVYGIDGSAVAYTLDANRDGTILGSDGDKAYVYFGLRGGGNAYYALDVTDPDAPVFMWSLSAASTGFSELAQSWSTPVVTKIPGYTDGNGVAKPVLIFGAGYDPVKDSQATLATPSQDTGGRGMFIVDAVTGALVWSITPAANSTTNMQATSLVHSIPADVNALDSNGDGLTDRVYLADTGGNLWRVDMPGNTRPTNSQNTWFITHLFKAVEGTRTKRTDRRFFNRPDVVSTNVNGNRVDVITIGTGDRTNPISKDNPTDTTDPTVDEQFYMIRDLRATIYRTAPPTTTACTTDPTIDFRCRLPLAPSNLYDITPNSIQSTTASVAKTATDALKAAYGWKLDLAADGEKVLSESRTLNGTLEFVTFSPVVDVVGCGFSAGQARNYQLDLFTGIPKQTCKGATVKTRSCLSGSGIHDLDTLFVDSDGEISGMGSPTTGTDTTGIIEDKNVQLAGPYGSYWEREDY